MGYRNNFSKEYWFYSANLYCIQHYQAVANRFVIASRYVEIHTDNRNTFSYEFASILRDCGSIFASTMDALVKGATSKKGNTSFKDYRDFLCSEIPNIHTHFVQISYYFPEKRILPFESLINNDSTPQWWQAYTKVKHNEYNSYNQGNLENSLTALSALVLLIEFGNLPIESYILFDTTGEDPGFEIPKPEYDTHLFPKQQ